MKLRINKDFAKRFEHKKKREHLEKSKKTFETSKFKSFSLIFKKFVLLFFKKFSKKKMMKTSNLNPQAQVNQKMKTVN